MAPSIESEVHKALREVADAAAITVFADNVRKLLLAAPFGPKPVLGVDPGLRTGCKLAVIDASGRYLGSGLMHLETPAGKAAAAPVLAELVKKGGIRAVAVGNGTAGRETETFVREALRHFELDVPVVMVSEAGASVYSASDVAREEFPDLDVTVRGAISIARRLQDPLAELVKIDPKSIGVGQYQHDVSQTGLKKSLDGVVDSCVNQVGVNVNTASAHLLARVSGIGPGLARAIVDHRSKDGLYKSRDALLEVPRFSKKTFEQAAGFLRIPDARPPARQHRRAPGALPGARRPGVAPRRADVGAAGRGRRAASSRRGSSRTSSAPSPSTTSCASWRSRGAIRATASSRSRSAPTSTSSRISSPAWCCPGIVTNVTNFGAFVDIGVHQDGLVHISQLSDKFIKDPKEVVNAGDRVTVRVLEVKLDRKQIALTMKSERSAPRNPGRTPPRRARPGGPPPARDRGAPAVQAAAPEAGDAVQQPVRRRARQQDAAVGRGGGRLELCVYLRPRSLPLPGLDDLRTTPPPPRPDFAFPC